MKKNVVLITSLLCLLALTSCKETQLCGAGFSVSCKNCSDESLSLVLFWNTDGMVTDDTEDTKVRHGAVEIAPGQEKGSLLSSSYDTQVKKGCLSIRIEKASGEVLWQGAGWPEEWKTKAPEGWNQVPSTDYNKYGLGFIDYDITDSYNMFYYDDSGKLIDNNDNGIIYAITVNKDLSVELKKE